LTNIGKEKLAKGAEAHSHGEAEARDDRSREKRNWRNRRQEKEVSGKCRESIYEKKRSDVKEGLKNAVGADQEDRVLGRLLQ